MSQFISEVIWWGNKMTDDNRNTTLVNEGADLLPPRFDQSASASAQPVQPIPRTELFDWLRNLNSRRRRSRAKLPALVLVVISGLALGTMGAIALVKERRPAVEPPPASQSVSELAVSLTSPEQLNTAEVGATGFQSNGSNTTRPHKIRPRPRSNGAPRAYRVSVIR